MTNIFGKGAFWNFDLI